MIVPVLFFLLCATITESLLEGDSCSLTNGSHGTCAFLINCTLVFDELVAGTTPDTICGYDAKRVDPIICCPTKPVTNTAPISFALPQAQADERGAIARRKCAEYSQYVYTVKYPPLLISHPVNVSQCAIRSQKLIVGTTKAERMEFPHMAAVGYNLQDGDIGWYCGGTLISENFVLTAAQCTNSRTLGNATWVRLGDLNVVRSDDGANPMDYRVAERIRHPDFKNPVVYHDIALLRLETRVSFNGWIRPACLLTEPPTGTMKAIATGWGHLNSEADEGSSDLKKITIPVIDRQTCKDKWASYTVNRAVNRKLPNGVIADWLICAGRAAPDTFQGDTGGPLVIHSQPQYYCMYDVVGTTSAGKIRGSDVPSLYTRVNNYIPWIESIVWGKG